MECKNNTRNQPITSGTSHFTESNAGHITVKTTSPFLNRIHDSEYNLTEKKHKQSKKTSELLLNKKLPKDIASGTSKMLINQILGDRNIDSETILNLNKRFTEKNLNHIEQACKYDQKIPIINVNCNYSTPTFNSESFSMHRGTCSGEDSIVPSKPLTRDRFNYVTCSKMSIDNKEYVEKATYCRPGKTRNLDFLNKTVERSNRLKNLVEKLIDIRKKEKQTEAWNNYINELKNKHGYGDIEHNEIIDQYWPAQPASLEHIEEFLSSSLKERKETLCNFYKANNISPHRNFFTYQVDCKSHRILSDNNSNSIQHKSYFNHPHCYPISSQGRLMLLNRKQNKRYCGDELKQFTKTRPFQRNTIYVDREPTRPTCRKAPPRRTHTRNKALTEKSTNDNFPLSFISTSVQTEISAGWSVLVKEDMKSTEKDYYQNKDINVNCERTAENIVQLKESLERTCNIETLGIHQNILQNIETKLDSLLTSINSFIGEVKSKTYINKHSNSQPIRAKTLNCKCNTHSPPISRSDTFGLMNAEKLVCGLLPDEPKFVNKKVQNKTLMNNCSRNDKKDVLSGKVIDYLKIDNRKNYQQDVEMTLNTNLIKYAKMDKRNVEQDIESILSGNVGHYSEMKSGKLNKKEETEDIFRECSTELDKRKFLKQDPENIFNSELVNCSVQISFDIPTKERSTEVTKSLPKTVLQLEDKSVSIEEVETNSSGEDRLMTIAVNTDPLSLLALLRVSTETVKQFLSYVPNIPIEYYLSFLNFPQRTEMTHYICNICGAAFSRPSQLSDHIRLHNLGVTRDCCVCRHVLDRQSRRPSGLFRCQYCGQRFTRAYCCELHQESCARRLGRSHDVTRSLMLLR